MVYQERIQDTVAEYASLSLAIDKLMEGKEKSWGCFQVKKEGEFNSLYIPALPSFKLYQNVKSIIYRGYWRKDNSLPKPTDTKSFPPDLWIKKKQKKVTIRQKVAKRNPETSQNDDQRLIYQFQSPSDELISKKAPDAIKKQRIYEIVYRYHPAVEVRVVNQLVANFVKEKIIASIVAVPEEEIFPLVLVGNPE